MRQILKQPRPIRTKAVRDIVMVNSESETACRAKRYHFIGAGGIGMSGLAKILIRQKNQVSGSDQQDSELVRQLNDLGGTIRLGHEAQHVPADTDAVVISAAIRESNPELAEARRMGCRVYKYAEMLGELMNRMNGIAVAGTHGKSTTSGWLSFVMRMAGMEPNFIVGAEVLQLGDSSGTGTGPWFIAEACEYDRSFLNLHPRIAVILNIEQDHLDYYRDEDDIVDAFTDFARGTRPEGVVIANGDDRNSSRVIERVAGERRVIRFGFGIHNDYFVQNIGVSQGMYEYDVYRGREFLGRVSNTLPGSHNVMNALAVIACCVEAGMEPRKALGLLDDFNGIDRRMMLKAMLDGITVVDDYAHHPTEIRACLKAIRERFEPRRLWCVFQPHQYSRTRFLLDDFAESFKLADVTIVPEIYFVRDTAESKTKVNAEVLVSRIRDQQSEAMFINDFKGILEYLKRHVRGGDLVITMGAGDVWKVADEYIQWLRDHRKDE